MKASRALALFVAAALVTAPACGLGDKQAQADVIAASREKGFASKGAIGLMRIEIIPGEDSAPVTVAEQEGAAAVLGGAPRAAGPLSVEARLAFDFVRRSVEVALVPPPNPIAALAGEEGGPVEGEAAPVEGGAPAVAPAVTTPPPPIEAPGLEGATALFHTNTLFAKRSNVRPTERRLWAKLDYSKLPDDENPPELETTPGYGPLIAAVNTVNPTYIFELVEGVLAGSMKKVGTEEVAGALATKYEANISMDKAYQDLELDDKQLEIRQLMFRLLRVYDDVRPAKFWVDDQGLLRKATFEFRQRVDRNEANDLHITLEMNEYGKLLSVPIPNQDETVEMERYGRMVRSVLPTNP